MKQVYNLSLQDDQIVIYADIIGFSNMLYENEKYDQNYSGNSMIICLNMIIDDIVNSVKNTSVKCNIFSDSIFMSASILESEYLISVLAEISSKLLTMGLAIKGGIAYGKIHHQENIWGMPLVKAVNMEKLAIYPRVIIEEETLYKMELSENSRLHFSSIGDGYWYFDFFSYLCNIDWVKNNYNPFLSTWINSIKNAYQSANEDKHKEKWVWLANCLNKNIIIHSTEINKQYEEDMALYTKRKTADEYCESLNLIN